MFICAVLGETLLRQALQTRCINQASTFNYVQYLCLCVCYCWQNIISFLLWNRVLVRLTFHPFLSCSAKFPRRHPWMDFFCLAGFFSGLISSSARAKPPRNNWYVRPGYAWILRYIHAPLRLNILMSLVPWSDLKEWLDLIDHSTFLELPSISLVDFCGECDSPSCAAFEHRVACIQNCWYILLLCIHSQDCQRGVGASPTFYGGWGCLFMCKSGVLCKCLADSVSNGIIIDHKFITPDGFPDLRFEEWVWSSSLLQFHYWLKPHTNKYIIPSPVGHLCLHG